ncbi:MAG TPA: PH domain-containing protein [Acidimicrobiia bacterium]|nr:PH domain-containing protein [Acidimicrobiia bacterium]
MSVAIASFPAAPLDRAAQMLTRLVWALAAVLVVLAAVVAASQPVAGGVLLLAALLDAGLGWWLRGREPVAYVLEDDSLVVERKSARPEQIRGVVRGAHRGSLGLRVAGDGGAYGYLGKFRAGGETVSAFVTSRKDVVLVTVGGRRLALSPADPDGFIAALGGGDGDA